MTISAARLPATSIREIDFKNFAYPWGSANEPREYGQREYWHWISRVPLHKVMLLDGEHRFLEEGGDDSDRNRAPGLWMNAVTYGDLDGDQEEEAAVELRYSTGGTANWKYLYVYKLENGIPKLLAWLESGSRAYGGLVKIAIQNGLLVLDFADPERRIGDCCSEGFIRVRYKWAQGHFAKTGSLERGDLKLEIRPTQ